MGEHKHLLCAQADCSCIQNVCELGSSIAKWQARSEYDKEISQKDATLREMICEL